MSQFENTYAFPNLFLLNCLQKKFEYLLVTIEVQKGKKFGLTMVHTENHVLVTQVEEGSMCSGQLRNLDRICDVEGVPVTDKELTKKQIIKGLKANKKVSLAVERPVNCDRAKQVKHLISLMENQPPSVVLEDDVRDILNRYNSKLKANSKIKPKSALSAKKMKKGKRVCLNDKQLEMVNIGMDNEHLQEDLEKVPPKTYETSLARLQNQGEPAKPQVI